MGLIGVAATHTYHVLGNRRQTATLSKLPDKIVDILKGDIRDKLSIKELNELIWEKAIDWDAIDEPPGLLYKACPRCGNTDLTTGTFDGPRDHVYYVIGCKKCDWSEYTE